MTTSAQPIWVLDDDSSIRWVLERAFLREQLQCRSFSSATELYQALATDQPRVLVTDIRMPGDDGLQVLARVRQNYPAIRVIVMTAHSDLDSAVSAFQGGAFEYLAKPFDLSEATAMVHRALQQDHEADLIAERDTDEAERAAVTLPMAGMIGHAPAMQDVFRAIGRLSNTSVTVLITGQSGTGKELVARALHQHSPRAEKPFIALNMAAIPSELVESELFGHEKGAFTGATQRRQGRFEQAHGGTLFLDEIGDMPLAVQTRLLRVLADGQFYPIGSYQPVSVDVRIIAATHQPLEQRVADGLFREDLLHRLNVIRLQLPTLAERTTDIPQLAQFFLQQAAHELGVAVKRLSAGAEQQLCRAAWPGNVRQLENTCRWLTVMAPSQLIGVNDLPEEIQQQRSVGDSRDWQQQLKKQLQQQLALGHSELLTQLLPQVEQLALELALEYTQGHKQKAAMLLGWGRNTVTRKLKESVNNE
jgi:two-component system nitrogen regulation response regulator GlnG